MLTLSVDQKTVVFSILEWIKNPHAPTLTLGGYAGTGKTTIIASLAKIIHNAKKRKIKVAYAAYTGKASRVLDASLKQVAGITDAQVSTIHALMYAPITSGGTVSHWKKKEDIKADLIIVDEASMISHEIWKDLTSYGIPILAVGDHGQLPPINSPLSLMEHPDLRLETIHRQAAGNPIIKLSKTVRETGTIPIGDFGSGTRKLDRYDASSGQEVEELLMSNNDIMILTGFNHTRVKINQQMRAYQDRYEPAPGIGDTVICLKNNWDKNIYNGMLGKITALSPITLDDEIHWYDAEIILDGESQPYIGKISAHQFHADTTITNHEGIADKELGDLFDFGYALTVHKAQGSQAENVLLFEERNRHMSDEDWQRWLYTGVTRAQERLTIVGI